MTLDTELFSAQGAVSAALPEDDPLVTQLRLRMIGRIRDLTAAGVRAGDLIPGLNISYVQQPQKVTNCFYTLSVALILQGTKHLVIGSSAYDYGTGAMLVTSVDMPTSYELLGVKPSEPFVSLSLRLDPALLAELIAESGQEGSDTHEVFTLTRPAEELLEDFERLLRLLASPGEIAMRAPMVIRDIHCLALAGAGGDSLRALYTPGATGQRIRKAIRWLREHFREEITVADMAEAAGMGETTFRRHFKLFTSLSPLQYQKYLRLYEAQQFLIRGDGDVNSAAYEVGYASPSQFNRDYKRHFGVPPGKSVRSQKQTLSSWSS